MLVFLRSKGASESMMHEIESALGRLINADDLIAKGLCKRALPLLGVIADASDSGTRDSAPAIRDIFELRKEMEAFISSLVEDCDSGNGKCRFTVQTSHTVTCTNGVSLSS